MLRLLLLLLLPLLPSSHSTHSSHTLSTYTLSTTHSVNIHFCQHTLCHHFVNIHFAYSHLHTHTHTHNTHFVNITLCQHTLCQHTLSTHTLSTYTSVNTHFVTTLSTYTLLTHTYIHTHTHNTHFVNIHFCQHTLCHHFVNIHFAYSHFNTHTHTHTHKTYFFAWQAWYLVTFTVVSRGRRGTHGTVWRAWSGLVARGAAALCVAGVALGDIHLRFAWQAWYLVTFTVVSRGRRGTHGTVWRAWSGLVARGAAALCVAGVALGDIHLHFAWQAWYLVTFTVVSRGRRGTHGTVWRAWSGLVARGAAALCVAGVALGDIHLRFTWQAWHLVTFTVVSRGRRGTHGTVWRAWSGLVARGAAALCVAGVALGDIHLHFAWQAWYLVTFTVVSRGRRGTHGTVWRAWSGLVARGAAALCVAGVALGDIHLRFAWQAWYLVTFTVVSRGRRGTHGTVWRAWSGLVARGAAALCVAGVALGDIHLHFAWQAWYLVTFTVVSRGRRGTHGTVWRAWSGLVARGAAALCVAGVALGDIHLHFAWQAWYLVTFTVVSRGRRGTHGTVWRAWSGLVARGAAALCVAGVPLGDIHLRFTWQAWNTTRVHRRFAWQAWGKDAVIGFGELRSRQLRYYVCDGTTTTTSQSSEISK